MKKLLPFLAFQVLAGDPRFVTIHEGESLTVRTGEAVELASGAGSNVSILASSASGRMASQLVNPDGKFNPFAYAGPATITLGESLGPIPSGFSGYATFRVWPGATDPQTVSIVPPGTNAVTVLLESSTNLVHWSSAASVTLTNVPAATFFRAKVNPD
jgi:hypothetical protein